MEIIFCSLCNESIPQGDLVEKRAVQRGGRSICARCDAAMSHGAQSALEDTAFSAEIEGAAGIDTQIVETLRVPAPSTSSANGLSIGITAALAALALVVAGGVGAFLWERTGRQEEGFARVERAQETAQAETLRVEARLSASIAEVAAGLVRSGETLQDLAERIDALSSREQAAGDAWRNDIAGLDARTTELEGVRAAIGAQEGALTRLLERVEGIQDGVGALAERVAAVERAREEPAPEAVKPAEPAAPAWRGFVEDLKNPNSGVRWQAVQSLGAARDPAVVEILVPMLRDSDIFVRMATARVLGDLGSTAAVSALIDTLEDPEASVREAADVALRAITGQDLEFDAGAKDAERSKRVKAWRDWWRRFSEETGGVGNLPGAAHGERA